MSIISTGRLKLIIKPFDSGWNYILDLSFKLISLLVIWSWKCNNTLKKKVTSLQTSITQVCWSALDIFPRWISKPRIRKHKNHNTTSKGAGRFAHILRASKKSRYNARNCKSRKHNQRHTSWHHNTWYKPSLTNILYYGLKVKQKMNRKTNNPSPHQRKRMLCVLNLHQDTSIDHLLMDSGHDNHSCINLPYCQGSKQVDSSIDLQGKMILLNVVTQPTKKTRSVGPHKLIPKKNRNKRKSRLENKKFRSVIKPLYGISAPLQHLLYKN